MAYLPSSATLIQTITAVDVATTTTLASSMNPAPEGTDLTFTATVTAADGSAPTGMVQFYADGAPLGAAVALDPTGTTTVDLPGTTLTVGDHNIEALFVP